jgi:hypothetical protein
MSATLRLIAVSSAAALAGSILAASSVGTVQAADIGQATGTIHAASAAQAARTVRVSVVGIDRAGAQVSVTAMAESGTNPPVTLTSRPNAIAPGKYWIGADVLTPATGAGLPTVTLVVKHVSISHSETVSLDARPGRLVKISLGVPGAFNLTAGVQVCVPGTQTSWNESLDGSVSALYVVPLKSRSLVFGYSGTWQADNAGYYVARQVRDGIPRRPDYQIAPAGLVEDRLVLRGGTTTGSYQFWQLQRQFSSQCDIDVAPLPIGATPSASIAYFSPGAWQIQVYGPQDFWGSTRVLKSGHRYTDMFGAAVWGPGVYYPNLDFGQLSYFPEEPFADPMQPVGNECCDRSSITLSLHGRTLKHATLSEYKVERAFFYRLHSAGWYTMQIKATRSTPGAPLPAGLLSTSETTTWRFHVAPDYGTLDSVMMPVTSTRYMPEGLTGENQAPQGTATRIVVRVLRAAEPGWISRNFPLRTVHVQASFDGGKVWRAVRLLRRGGHWLALVPAAKSGYVALRSTVTDTHGDSTVQTIYRAYQIA